MRKLILFAAVMAWPFALSSSACAAPKNVLLLISDNHSAADLGCYGSPNVRTPNLDQLAARGTRFLNSFATVASCGPSRGVIYTGLLTHANGQFTHGHGFHNGVLLPGVRSVFDIVKDAGYRTGLFGKTSFYHLPSQYQLDEIQQRNNRDLPTLTKQAEEFIRSGGDAPFLVALCTHDPHPSGLLSDARRRLKPPPPRAIDPAAITLPSSVPDRPDVREEFAEYYEYIERVDAGFGEALAMLERIGKADDTLVIFFSDQGGAFPHGYTQYEPAVHVPMIVVDPTAKRRGLTTDAMVSLADITPTVLDWTSVRPPYPLHGRSVLPIVEQEHPQGWDSVVLSHVMHEVTMYYPMRTLRERRYKLIWNICHQMPFLNAKEVEERSPWRRTIESGEKLIGKRSVEKYVWRDPIELYDLENDPDELVNLADDPKHADLRREMSERLLKHLRKTDDHWLERYRMPLPGEKVEVMLPPPPGYAPERKRGGKD
ncbi:MAG: sulfatase [Planctomycetaceae bacterium]|nr:sulfatase [Planctomycetaceae bacterium]